MQPTGNTILLTGGTSGIGFEFARQLLALGNTVVITGRDAGRLKSAQRKLPGVHCIESDVADAGGMPALRRRVTSEFPLLNVLINNAGIMRKIDLQKEIALPAIVEEIATNFAGPVQMTQCFLPHLLSQPASTIINISSGLAFVPFAVAPIYCATKAAIHSYTQSLRLQLEGSTVEVIEVAPPLTNTPLATEEFTSEDVGGGKPMDVALLVRRAMKGITRGTAEIRPGMSAVLHLMGRVMPVFAARQLGKAVALLPRTSQPQPR